MGGSCLYCAFKQPCKINNHNCEALTCNCNWVFLLLRRHISQHFTFSSHLTDPTSNHLQSLSVKPHFCCPEASDSLPARTQECVKIKGDFLPLSCLDTCRRWEKEGSSLRKYTATEWAETHEIQSGLQEKRGRKSSSCHIVVYESPESLSALQQICASWQLHEGKSSLLRFKVNQTKIVLSSNHGSNAVSLFFFNKGFFLSQTINIFYSVTNKKTIFLL